MTIKRTLLPACALWATLLCSTARSQFFPLDTLALTGPEEERVNIVFLSEGYTSTEMGDFQQDVQNALASLFVRSPYWQYQSYFNVYAIEVPSNQSGTDHPGTASDEPGGLATFFSDTYFGSTFDFGGIHRLLVPQQGPIDYVLANNFPGWDIAFVVVNHEYYGGAGGSVATFSTHASSGQIAIHEVGHSFAGLADEYDYGGVSGYEAPNATAETIRPLIKWNTWIEASTPVPTPEITAYNSVIGLFEGAVYNPTGWYRPKLQCMMNTLGPAFCEVCVEQTVLSCYNLIDAIAPDSPSVLSVSLPGNASLPFVVRRLQPLGQTVSLEWRVDGSPAGSNGDSLVFDANLFALGPHTLTAISRDTTPLVRMDMYNLLESTVEWTVQVQAPSPCPILLTGDVDTSGTITSSDVIRLVNYVFKGGAVPQPCWVSGDIDCTGAITSADIIVLVNFVFKSGPDPCDACTLLEPGWWPCP